MSTTLVSEKSTTLHKEDSCAQLAHYIIPLLSNVHSRRDVVACRLRLPLEMAITMLLPIQPTTLRIHTSRDAWGDCEE
jgi:hypothetical protein